MFTTSTFQASVAATTNKSRTALKGKLAMAVGHLPSDIPHKRGKSCIKPCITRSMLSFNVVIEDACSLLMRLWVSLFKLPVNEM
jgi:hypothetical protein